MRRGSSSSSQPKDNSFNNNIELASSNSPRIQSSAFEDSLPPGHAQSIGEESSSDLHTTSRSSTGKRPTSLEHSLKDDKTMRQILSSSNSARANFQLRFENSTDEDRRSLEIILEGQSGELGGSGLSKKNTQFSKHPSESDSALAEEIADFEKSFAGTKHRHIATILSFYLINLILCVAAAALIIAGITFLEEQRPWDATWDTRKVYIAELLIAAAAVCASIPLVEVLVHIFLAMLELMYRSPKVHKKPSMQTLYLFATGLKVQVARFIYIGIDFIAALVIYKLLLGVPISDLCPTGARTCFMYIYQYISYGVQKFFAVLWLWAGFRVIGKALTINMSKHFNNRTHRSRIYSTLQDELQLCILLKRVPNLMLISMLEVYGNDDIVISPTMNARGTAYVFQHDMEGEFGDVMKVYSAPRTRFLAAEIFNRIFLHLYPEKEQMLRDQNKRIKEASAASSVFGKSLHSDRPRTSSSDAQISTGSITLKKTPKISRRHFLEYFDECLSGLGMEGELLWENLLDPNTIGFITLKRCVEAIDRITENRKAVITGIIDTNRVIKSLDFAIAMGLNFVVVILSTMILEISWGSGFSAFTSMILSFAFIFGNSAQAAFNSIIFIFAMTPYNVGDKVQIISLNTSTMTVEHIYLLTTVFRTWDGSLYVYANAELLQQLIMNVTLSSKKWSLVYFTVDTFALTPDRLQDYREKMESLLLSNSEMFTGSFSLTIREIQDELKYYIGFCVEHNATMADSSKINKGMSLCLNELGQWMIADGVTWSSTERNFNRELIKHKTKKD